MEPGETMSAEAAEAEPAQEGGAAETSEQMLIEQAISPQPDDEGPLKAVLEAIIYVAEEPVTVEQVAAVVNEPEERVKAALARLAADYTAPGRGLIVREVAGGYKLGTKPEHHEAIRAFAKSLKPPLKLSLAALETLAVIAYKQPITAPEVQEIRGVQGAGVLKTLLDRRLITTAGRKNVIGKPILYKTTKDFLLQFGLKDLSELPTLKEFEDLRRLALNESGTDTEPAGTPAAPASAEGPPTGSEEAAAAADEPPTAVKPSEPAGEGTTAAEETVPSDADQPAAPEVAQEPPAETLPDKNV